jgi:hypothetical protein
MSPHYLDWCIYRNWCRERGIEPLPFEQWSQEQADAQMPPLDNWSRS